MIVRRRRMVFYSPCFDGGKGASLYVGTAANAINYGRSRCGRGRSVHLEPLPLDSNAAIAVVHHPDTFTGIDLTAYAPGTVYLDVRTFSDQQIENESEGYPLKITLDAGLDAVTALNGSGRVVAVEARVGGVVRFTFVWRGTFGASGETPTDFVLRRISGPTSPADVVLIPSFGLLVSPEDTFTIDTVALTSGGVYVFHVFARTSTGVEFGLPGIDNGVALANTVTADSEGPPAVTLTIASL